MKLSARNLVKAGTSRLGKDALDLMKHRRVERLQTEQERANVAHLECQAVLGAASELMATKKPENAWTTANYETVLKSLRRAKTEKIPKKKSDLVQSCE